MTWRSLSRPTPALAVAVAALVVALGAGGSVAAGTGAASPAATTTPALSTLTLSAYIYPNTNDSPSALSAPTTATLALTDLAVDNSLNVALANNNTTVALEQITVGSTGSCNDSDRTVTVLRRYGVLQGQTLATSYPEPIQVAPVAKKAYCVAAQVHYVGTTASSSYPVAVSVGALVVSGKYVASSAGATAQPELHPAP